ncbi:jg13063 [Pararge aegeria aegeria]|uniref:Jg13063 protein n=1 Tax=Pararge aegeria aegeria TaxID=348720 RepID=A0A8S4S712_9NEOP|nr:jg13063 [Pararge aegeria aegeria]
MDNLFIVFDPSFLSYVWPKIKNGVHLNIGHFCWEDVSVLLKDLAEGRAWAYRAADASGRYQSGLFEGKRFWLGSKEQCLKLDSSYVLRESNETWGEFYSGDYLNTLISREKEFAGNIDEWHSLIERDDLMRRVVEDDNEAAVPLAYTALQIMLNITKFTMPKSYQITLGLCLPRTCAAEDVVSIINFSIMLNDHLKTNKTVSRSVKITSLRYIENSYDIKTDITAVAIILVTVTLVVLAIVATFVDFDLIKFKAYGNTSSFDLQQYNYEDKRYADEKKINIGRKDPASYDLHSHDEKRYADEKKANFIKKEHKLVEAEALSVKSFSELKRAMREKALPPSITLDVGTPEGSTSCYRCGKYKKQCVNSSQVETAPPCPRLKYNSCASLTTEYKRKSSVYKSLLLSFSLKHSWMRIINTSMANKDLAMMHVLKIIAVLWIMFVHVAVTVDYIAGNDILQSLECTVRYKMPTSISVTPGSFQ